MLSLLLPFIAGPSFLCYGQISSVLGTVWKQKTKESSSKNTLLCVQLKGIYGWEVPSCTGRTKSQGGQQWRAEHLDVCPYTLLGNMTSDNWRKVAQEVHGRSGNWAQTSFSSPLYSNHLVSKGGCTWYWSWKIVSWPPMSIWSNSS